MNTHNRINYIEFTAPDLEAVKKFYGNAFEWKFTDYGPGYVAFNDGALDGGFAKGERRAGGAPMIILYSENIATTQEAIEKAGGKIVQAAYDFPGGRRFHFTDPAGNELAVWSEK
ncbi:MAG: VOC family protein [Patescibacteria group bacterium]